MHCQHGTEQDLCVWFRDSAGYTIVLYLRGQIGIWLCSRCKISTPLSGNAGCNFYVVFIIQVGSMGEEGAIGEVHGDLDFVPRWVVRFFLISSGRSSVGAFIFVLPQSPPSLR